MPKAAAFRIWFRDKKYSGSVERNATRVVFGKPVPRTIALAFIDYIKKIRKWDDLTFETAFVTATSMDAEGVWKNWPSVLSGVASSFRDNEGMYLQRPGEARKVAEMIISGVGFKSAMDDEPLDYVSCLARGQLKMGRTVEKYARWIAEMWRCEFRSVLFASKGKSPAGVSIILPLTEVAYRRLIAGELSEMDLKPSDLCSPSRFLFVAALGEPFKAKRDRSQLQAHCMLYQAAYFTRGINPFAQFSSLLLHILNTRIDCVVTGIAQPVRSCVVPRCRSSHFATGESRKLDP